MPLVISNAAANTLTGEKCDRYVFRVSYSSAQISEPIGRWMAKNAPKNLYILGSDFVAGHEFVAAAKQGYLAGGGNIVGEVYTPFGRTQDYGPYISQARSANPGAVFAVYFGRGGLLLVKQYDPSDEGEPCRCYGPIGLTPPVLRQGARPTPRWTSYRRRITSRSSTTPENRKFRDEFKKKFGRGPGGIRRHGLRRRALHH